MSIDPKKITQFVRIIRRGGTIVCNASTRARLFSHSAESAALWSGVRFRVSPHMRDGRIAAFTHDSQSTPVDLTDAESRP